MIRIKQPAILFSVLLLILSACNSGGGSSSGSNPVPTSLPTPTTPYISVSVSPNYGNTNSVCDNVNSPCVSVTVCNSGQPQQCETVPNVLLDSGSIGLRIFSSAFQNDSFVNSLPIESGTDDGSTIAECLTYGDYSANWGPIALASISLNGESTTSQIPMQLINSAYPDVESKCSAAQNTTPLSFGLNGILGVGPYTYDNAVDGAHVYYSCNSSGSCSSITPESPVANPIAFFSEDLSNGITIEFPGIGALGAANVSGYAIFGVGTNSDNSFGDNVKVYKMDPNPSNCFAAIGCIETSLAGAGNSITLGFLDTGSNFMFFQSDISYNPVHGYQYYTPSPAVQLTASNTSTDGAVATSFNIANADNVFGTNNSSFNNIGYYFNGIQNNLDYGLPFFFGKTVYICYDGQTCNGQSGPYWAF